MEHMELELVDSDLEKSPYSYSLPPEVWESIWSHLDLNSLKQVRLACRYWNYVSQTLFQSRILFRLNFKSIQFLDAHQKNVVFYSEDFSNDDPPSSLINLAFLYSQNFTDLVFRTLRKNVAEPCPNSKAFFEMLVPQILCNSPNLRFLELDKMSLDICLNLPSFPFIPTLQTLFINSNYDGGFDFYLQQFKANELARKVLEGTPNVQEILVSEYKIPLVQGILKALQNDAMNWKNLRKIGYKNHKPFGVHYAREISAFVGMKGRGLRALQLPTVFNDEMDQVMEILQNNVESMEEFELRVVIRDRYAMGWDKWPRMDKLKRLKVTVIFHVDRETPNSWSQRELDFFCLRSVFQDSTSLGRLLPSLSSIHLDLRDLRLYTAILPSVSQTFEQIKTLTVSVSTVTRDSWISRLRMQFPSAEVEWIP